MMSQAYRFTARSYGRDLVYSWSVNGRPGGDGKPPESGERGQSFVYPWTEHPIIIRGVELLIFPQWGAIPPWYRWFMVGNSYVDDIMLMASGKDRRVSHFFPHGGFAFPGTKTGKAEHYLDLHGSCAPFMKASVFLNFYYEPAAAETP